MNKELLALYFICGSQDCPNGNLLATLEKALEAGISLYQFREKGNGAKDGIEKRNLALAAQKLCQSYGVPFIINDDIDLAIELDADGIHIGQDDMPLEQARKLFPDKIIGLSINNMTEFHHSQLNLVNYVGLGPYKATISKADAKTPTGLSLIQGVREVDKALPIVAIGGIQEEDVEAIIANGADGIAVISAISRSQDISKTSRSLKEEVEKHLAEKIENS
ncbi:hypothetical protein AT575_05075 [Streptococcus penaeicida]|uniref:Thiamine-phosphate synthase n=1 Tax=Streptococcus penaeicida TaxID=1765960 RepID=A0A2N8LC71_9STRE|nr:thiamine phosphate synthase [Streptococcus penaeicida]PND47768.1 hypothetical protein AT575_05075 [Streptococcus penaeicida]